MENKLKLIVLLFIFGLFLMRSSFALFRNSLAIDHATDLAEWDVTLEQDGINNSLTVIPGLESSTYTLNVKSLSEVDIKYPVNITNLPSGIEASINGVDFYPEVNGVITFPNEFTILFGSLTKINTHTLTFRGTNNSTYVNNQAVSVNVEAVQVVSS